MRGARIGPSAAAFLAAAHVWGRSRICDPARVLDELALHADPMIGVWATAAQALLAPPTDTAPAAAWSKRRIVPDRRVSWPRSTDRHSFADGGVRANWIGSPFGYALITLSRPGSGKAGEVDGRLDRAGVKVIVFPGSVNRTQFSAAFELAAPNDVAWLV